mgnify:CR=1 FL=1
MEMPSVENTIKDAERGVTYVVMAYRTLTRAEVLSAVGSFLGQKKRKPKRGSVVRIITILGFDGG